MQELEYSLENADLDKRLGRETMIESTHKLILRNIKNDVSYTPSAGV